MASIQPNAQSRARIVPWRSSADLLWIKEAFHPGPEAPDQRYDALTMAQAWSVRGKLPHSIEATAMLTEAIMHDRPGASQLNLQLSYSTAICRFVNGLLDPAQQSHFAISMHTLARNLNLPASFVEIRHAATHENLPSLAVLRTAASRALGWLWSNYWVWVGATPIDEVNPEVEPQDVNLSRARLLLKQWRKLRRQNPTREIKEGENVPESREALAIIRDCVGICGTTEGLDGVVDAFLEEKALIPSGKKKSSALMKGAFLLWLPLLEPLDVSAPNFAEQLISSMLEILTPMDYALDELKSGSTVPFLASSPPVPKDREFNKALVAWIKHFTGASTSCKFGRTTSPETGVATLDIDNFAKQCIFRPNKWTLDILAHIFKCHPALNSKYSALASIAQTQASFAIEASHKDIEKKVSKTNSTTRALQDIEDELLQFEEKLASMDSQMEEWMQRRYRLREGQNQNGGKQDMAIDGQKGENGGDCGNHKWTKYPGVWTPRPIGVL
ncbi:Las1-domain-containing protein [Terfezia boudieri ATCC MYA-4762]|uniref:Las1-domain-containing protein n=1 Tax=Terfezia boudieri ATCC MYA-4762 TaxID=1051890 RepID=A0A3N4LQ27_9PEZI|nr:Las1-domain-containing protein [Terfezia boudieri ATCC MYA-4762]